MEGIMKRILLRAAYDGSGYCGWQLQKGVPTIEGELNRALTELLGKEIVVIGASRTDAGVHALGNVAVFDTESPISAEKFAPALNQRLPEDIRIQDSKEVPADFHPRRTNSRKLYEYRILNRNYPLPTKRLYSCFYRGNLDVDKMGEAAEYLIGTHDFTSFCSVNTVVEDKVRTITGIDVYREDEEILIRVEGTGFLYNMVRIIAGTLMEVGRGRLSPERIQDILAKKDRQAAGPTAPACGLTLVRIYYEELGFVSENVGIYDK